MLTTANYQGNPNQNYNEASPHIGQDGYHQEVHNYNMLESVWRKGKHRTLLVRMLIDTATMENNMVVPLKTKNQNYHEVV